MRKPRYYGYERSFWRRHIEAFIFGAALCLLVLGAKWIGTVMGWW